MAEPLEMQLCLKCGARPAARLIHRTMQKDRVEFYCPTEDCPAAIGETAESWNRRAPHIQLLEQLRDTIDAKVVEDRWVLPFYGADGLEHPLPIPDWIAARKEAARMINDMSMRVIREVICPAAKCPDETHTHYVVNDSESAAPLCVDSQCDHETHRGASRVKP